MREEAWIVRKPEAARARQDGWSGAHRMEDGANLPFRRDGDRRLDRETTLAVC